jgi:hypothetical protein
VPLDTQAVRVFRAILVQKDLLDLKATWAQLVTQVAKAFRETLVQKDLLDLKAA